MKHNLLILISFLSISISVNFPLIAAPTANDTASAPIPAQITDLSSQKYLPAALAAINAAKKSVYVCLYFIGYYGGEGVVKDLMDALVRARDRGADVCVILDGDAVPEAAAYAKNKRAFAYLYHNGIPVFYDEKGITTHSKLVIIDGTDVILGSTNWSDESLRNNREASVLIRSPEIARRYTDEFRRIPRNSPQPSLEGFPVPVTFFSQKIGAKLITNKFPTGLDLYLYACKKAAAVAQQGSAITFTPNELLKYVLYDLDPRYNTRVLSLAKKVAEELKKYGIITAVTPDYDKHLLTLTFPSLNEPVIASLPPADEAISTKTASSVSPVILSSKYFDYAWHTRLPPSAKFSYLVLLNETRNGALGRMMSFTSIRTLTSKYGISSKMFIYGFIELQRWNLIERFVNYDVSHPKTNDYLFNDFYSMEEFRAKFDALKAKTPPELFDAAYNVAVELNEPYDLNVIGLFIDACKQYGIGQFQAAARNITSHSQLSPYRTPSFLLTKLRKGLRD